MSVGPADCAELHLIVYLDWLLIVAHPVQGEDTLSATKAATKHNKEHFQKQVASIRVYKDVVQRTCLYDAYAGEAEYLCALDPDTCCLEQHCTDCRS